MFGRLHANRIASILLAEQAKLIQAESTIYSRLSHPDVVFLGSGKVSQREREGFRRNDSHLGINGCITATL